MTEHPIIFGGWAIPKLMDGTLTQTRRVAKPQPNIPVTAHPVAVAELLRDWERAKRCPYQAGQLLWVRETWSYITLAQNEYVPGDKWDPQVNMPVRMLYKADADAEGWQIGGRWSSPIFMPRWASRITLRIEAVRVERILDITSADIAAEGLVVGDYGGFAKLWDKLNRKRGFGWATNPWVWALIFMVVQ